MVVVNAMFSAASKSEATLLRLYALAFIGLELRNAVALFSRYTISEEQVSDLKKHCKQFFNSCHLFAPRAVTPTIWIIGHVVPEHTRKLREEIGFGLGIGTTQGREANVQIAKQYTWNTVPRNKWQMFFRHEYMHLIWLSKHITTEDSYHETKDSYLPKGVQAGTTCACGEEKLPTSTKCKFCSHQYHSLVESCAKADRLSEEYKRITNTRQHTLM